MLPSTMSLMEVEARLHAWEDCAHTMLIRAFPDEEDRYRWQEANYYLLRKSLEEAVNLLLSAVRQLRGAGLTPEDIDSIAGTIARVVKGPEEEERG